MGVFMAVGFIWAVLDDSPGQGIVGYISTSPIGGGFGTPLITSEPRRVPWLRSQATEIARMTGRKLKIVRFERTKEEEAVVPSLLIRP